MNKKQDRETRQKSICSRCEHKIDNSSVGWCYMFKEVRLNCAQFRLPRKAYEYIQFPDNFLKSHKV